MRKLRTRWLAWMTNPDWRLAALVHWLASASVFVGLAAILLPALALFAVVDPRSDRAVVLVLSMWALVVSVCTIVVWRLRRRVIEGALIVKPLSFPAPVASEWQQRKSTHGQLVRMMVYQAYVCLVAGVAFALLLPLAVANRLFGIWVFIGTYGAQLAVAGIGFALVPQVARRVGALAEAHWEACKNALVSPAHTKSAELLTLAEDLRTRALSAEAIIREVDTAFVELQRAVSDQEKELNASMQALVTTQAAAEVRQGDVDALFAVWTERQRRESVAAERRARRFDLVVASVGLLVSLVAGYVFGALLPPETFRQLIHR